VVKCDVVKCLDMDRSTEKIMGRVERDRDLYVNVSIYRPDLVPK
jgi:hypothetical protein